MKFTIEMFTRGVDYTRYAHAYFSDAFNREIAVAVQLKEREFIERQLLPGGKERMRVRVVPHVALPGLIQKLVRDEIAYQEITVFDPKARTASLEITSRAGDIVQVTGQVHILEESAGVRLRFAGEARVRVLGVGSIIERFMVAEIKQRYAMVETAMQHFIDAGRDLAATLDGQPL